NLDEKSQLKGVKFARQSTHGAQHREAGQDEPGAAEGQIRHIKGKRLSIEAKNGRNCGTLRA
ncbi:hypothetical protein, partial [Polaromonas sp.]|uniref:hypothetical protein n=1 Tax=Polaromonas sp. TaxID=1869339 RepID=UPI0032641FFC